MLLQFLSLEEDHENITMGNTIIYQCFDRPDEYQNDECMIKHLKGSDVTFKQELKLVKYVDFYYLCMNQTCKGLAPAFFTI